MTAITEGRTDQTEEDCPIPLWLFRKHTIVASTLDIDHGFAFAFVPIYVLDGLPTWVCEHEHRRCDLIHSFPTFPDPTEVQSTTDIASRELNARAAAYRRPG